MKHPQNSQDGAEIFFLLDFTSSQERSDNFLSTADIFSC